MVHGGTAYAERVHAEAEPLSSGVDGPVWVIVVAGGGGTRYGAPKQFELVAGRRVIDWSIRSAWTVADGVVVVLPAADAETFVPAAEAPVVVVAGGATRAASVRHGLAAVPGDAGVILVHDAARPAASDELFARVVAAVRAGADGVVPGVAVTDSLRNRVRGAVDRDALVAVQTPQGFPASVLRAAHARGADASDDATLVEDAGGTIQIVDGEMANAKLTHPHDLISLAHALGGSV